MGPLRNCSCIILSSQWQVTLEIYLCVIVTDFHSRGRPLLWSSKTCLRLAGQEYKYYNLSMLWRRSLKDCRPLQDVSRVAPCLSVGCPKAWPETQDPARVCKSLLQPGRLARCLKQWLQDSGLFMGLCWNPHTRLRSVASLSLMVFRYVVWVLLFVWTLCSQTHEVNYIAA